MSSRWIKVVVYIALCAMLLSTILMSVGWLMQ